MKFSAAKIAYAKKMCKVLIVTGLAIVIAGAYQYTRIAEFVDRAVEVDGVVVEMESNRDNSMRPVVEWVDHIGETRTHYSNVWSSPPKFFVGERVTVLYDPNDPKYPVKAKINTTMQIFGVAIFLMIFGAAFCLIASVTWYVASKGGVIYFDEEK